MSEIVFEQDTSTVTIEGSNGSTIDLTETTGIIEDGQAVEITTSSTATIVEIPTSSVVTQNENSVSTVHISTGDKGEQGEPGPPGDGVAGGTSQQILVKQSSTDYDYEWETLIIGKATDAYAISNTDDAGAYKYFGFQDATGGWYILRKTVASNIFQYVKGTSAYATAWTDRTTQTYDTYENTF